MLIQKNRGAKLMQSNAIVPNDRQPGGQPLSGYRENFLYLIRCGSTESVPSRRILSFS
jgi:hypothetical protein